MSEPVTNKAFVRQLQPRDSILIADQLEYGVTLPALQDGTQIMLPQVKDTVSSQIMVVQPWRLDTLKTHKKDSSHDIEASMVLTTFEEGEYLLPDIPVGLVHPDGSVDTLVFQGQDVLVCTMPVDTATFKINDIKGQIKYPVTFMEVLPWICGALVLAGAVFGVIKLLQRRARARALQEQKDPPHIVALRKLDGYRGDKFWAPARQKAFYSGVTDALREYMSARYGIGAMEMTTAQIFDALGKDDLPSELRDELRDLFERSDFVKFAKYVASDEDNSKVLPLGIRFVTTTYQEDIKGENENVL